MPELVLAAPKSATPPMSAFKTISSLDGNFKPNKVLPDECLDSAQNLVLPTPTNTGPSWVFTINFWNQNGNNNLKQRVGCFIAFDELRTSVVEYHLVKCQINNVNVKNGFAQFYAGIIDCPFEVSDYFNYGSFIASKLGESYNSNFYYFDPICKCKHYWAEIEANLQNGMAQQVFDHPSVNFMITKLAGANLITTFDPPSPVATVPPSFTDTFSTIFSTSIVGMMKYRSELTMNPFDTFDAYHKVGNSPVFAGTKQAIWFNNDVKTAQIGQMTGIVKHIAIDPCGNNN